MLKVLTTCAKTNASLLLFVAVVILRAWFKLLTKYRNPEDLIFVGECRKQIMRFNIYEVLAIFIFVYSLYLTEIAIRKIWIFTFYNIIQCNKRFTVTLQKPTNNEIIRIDKISRVCDYIKCLRTPCLILSKQFPFETQNILSLGNSIHSADER